MQPQVQNREGQVLRFLVLAVAFAETASARSVPSVDASNSAPRVGATATSQHAAAVSAPSGLEPCGNDLPPCWVKRRESGGSYTAYNPTGCGNRGCFGAWQFSGAWAGKLGLPADLSTATPEQQDAAARELWNNGQGCSNWAACN